MTWSAPVVFLLENVPFFELLILHTIWVSNMTSNGICLQKNQQQEKSPTTPKMGEIFHCCSLNVSNDKSNIFQFFDNPINELMCHHPQHQAFSIDLEHPLVNQSIFLVSMMMKMNVANKIGYFDNVKQFLLM